MNILQVIPSLRSGGAEEIVTNYMLCLKNKDVESSCIAIYDSSENKKNVDILEKENVSLYFLIKKIMFGDKEPIVVRFVKKIIWRIKLQKKIFDIKPDIIHFHLIPFYDIFVTKILHPKVKLYYTMHNELFIDLSTRLNTFFSFVVVKLGMITIIGLHTDLKKDINKFFKKKCAVVIPNGVLITKFMYKSSERIKYRKKFSIARDCTVIGHVGSLSDQKNQLFLFDAFRIFYKKNVNSKLIIVGTGNKDDEYMQYAKAIGIYSSIIWLKNRSDIASILCMMDVFVFPSKFEGFGLAVLEAAINGLPCIISDRVPKFLADFKNVTYMSLDLSPKLWANKMQYYSHNIVDRFNHNLIEKKIINAYDMDNIINQLLTLYKSNRG